MNEYNPQTFITTEPLTDDPFKVMTSRQKERSYADAETQITTNGDVTKTTILEALETTIKIALLMTPLALFMPEVALGLEVFYLASGAAEVGIGADNIKHGKPGGSDQVVFGVLNALPSAVHGAGKLARAVESGEIAAGRAVEDPITPPTRTPTQKPAEAPFEEPAPDETAVPDSDGPTPSASTPENSNQPFVNRQPGIESNEINDYAVQDGEQLISGVTPNAKGIYQVKGPRGEDRWLIKVSYDENSTRVFEIQSSFKLDGKTVEIIDPFTRKPVMTVSNTGDETWEAVRTRGGDKKKPGKKTIPQDDSASTSSSNQPLTNHPDWQSILDSGMYNGKPVYIHYTDKAGLEAITRQRRISDTLRNETRAGSKGGIYVNPPGQQFNGENVESLLFLGNERYVGRGNYMVIFSSDQIPQNLGPITSGSPFVEMKMPKDINLTPSNILYMGPNTFPNYFG